MSEILTQYPIHLYVQYCDRLAYLAYKADKQSSQLMVEAVREGLTGDAPEIRNLDSYSNPIWVKLPGNLVTKLKVESFLWNRSETWLIVSYIMCYVDKYDKRSQGNEKT